MDGDARCAVALRWLQTYFCVLARCAGAGRRRLGPAPGLARSIQSVFTALLLVVSVAVPGAAQAGGHPFESDGIRGTVDAEGSMLNAQAQMHIDRSPEQVLAALTDYPRLGDWMPRTVAYRVVKTNGRNGRFWRESRGPPLIANPHVTIDATVSTMEDGHTRVTWRRVEGSIRAFDATWDLEPVQGGTRVTYRAGFTLPFRMPGFIIRRMAPSVVLDTMRGLRTSARSRPAVHAVP